MVRVDSSHHAHRRQAILHLQSADQVCLVCLSGDEGKDRAESEARRMTEYRRRLAAVGDGLLLAAARLYLYNRRQLYPYNIQAKLIGRMVSNERLIEIAAREGLVAQDGEKLSDAFEVEVAERFFNHGFRSTRLWLEQIYDKHFDLRDEVRCTLEPAPQDKLEKQVRGVLKDQLRKGQITDVQKTTRVILKALRDAGSI